MSYPAEKVKHWYFSAFSGLRGHKSHVNHPIWSVFETVHEFVVSYLLGASFVKIKTIMNQVMLLITIWLPQQPKCSSNWQEMHMSSYVTPIKAMLHEILH